MKRLFLVALLPVAALPLLPAAEAADSSAAANKAEHVRLTEEMKKLAQRNAWSAVEANYQKLLVLQKAGEALGYDDHWLGAQAARDAGDATAWKQRLEAARSVKATDEVTASLQEVAANFGMVKITVDSRYDGERVLSRPAMPFAPDQVANVRFVAARLKAGESYEGLLVVGAYTLDDKPLTVTSDQVATLNLAKEVVPFKVATGLRLNLGPAALFAGDAAAQSDSPDHLQTYGGRLGGGFDLALARSFSVFGELHYQGAVGQATIDGQPADGHSSSTHFGGVWLGVSYQLPVLWISAGATVDYVYARSAAAVTGSGGFYGEEGHVGTGENETVAHPNDLIHTAPRTQYYHAGGVNPGVALALDIPLHGFKIGNLTGGLAVDGGAVMADRVMAFGEVGLRFAQDFGG